jgi:hypothetical protein
MQDDASGGAAETPGGGGRSCAYEVSVGAQSVIVGDGNTQHNYYSGQRRASARETSKAVVSYLRVLANWLNQDPWPTDRVLGGPHLTPAAIERRLRVRAKGQTGEREADADDLAASYRRLVILGGPGSGKTWLAKRIARRQAERALSAMAAGAGPDDVELPLWTTASMLAQARPGDGTGIRAAVLASVFDQLPDLGGAEITEAVRAHFADRRSPILLVIDSLDEAQEPDARIKLTDHMHGWRIILTSRPGSWNGQLALQKDDPAHQEGDLQPLNYPKDVHPFIDKWFESAPQRADMVKQQLTRRLGLQQSAGVPLILAFYCIIGGDAPLPETRHELYEQVSRRILSGLWRSPRRPIDIDACLALLGEWAWAAAEADPISAVGTWKDEFPTRPGARGTSADPAILRAVSHVAVPVAPEDFDGITARRFIHRSIREYFVARHLSFHPAEEAAAELLNHLWHDPDWEYAAPAALAMHPARDQVLRLLLRRITGADADLAGLARMDGCFEVRKFLSAVASETTELAWEPRARDLIARVRQEIFRQRRGFEQRFTEYWFPAAGWPTADGPLKSELLAEIEACEGESSKIGSYLRDLRDLSPDAGEMAQARRILIDNMFGGLRDYDAGTLAGELLEFQPLSQESRAVFQYLVGRIEGRPGTWKTSSLLRTMAQMDLAADDRARVREAVRQLPSVQANAQCSVVSALADFAEVPAERTVAASIINSIFGSYPDNRELPEAEIHRLVDGLATGTGTVSFLVRQAIEMLDRGDALSLWSLEGRTSWSPAEAELQRDSLLHMLESVRDAGQARQLAMALGSWDPDPVLRARAKTVILRHLARATSLQEEVALASAAGKLSATLEERALIAEICDTISRFRWWMGVKCRTERAEPRLGRGPDLSSELLDLLTRLLSTNRAVCRSLVLTFLPEFSEPVAEVCFRFLGFTDGTEPGTAGMLGALRRAEGVDETAKIARILARFLHTPGDRESAAMLLVRRVEAYADFHDARRLLLHLGDLLGDLFRGDSKSALKGVALGVLESAADISSACRLIILLDRLAMDGGERRRAQTVLLCLLERDERTLRGQKDWLAPAVPALAPIARDMEPLLRALLVLKDPGLAARIGAAAADPELLASARREVLRCLDRSADERQARLLAGLRPADDERARGGRCLLALMHRVSPEAALCKTLEELWPDPRAFRDLREMTPRLDAAGRAIVRRHSPLPDWLEILPALPSLY